MYQMWGDVSFITGSNCPSISPLEMERDMAEYFLWLTLLSQTVIVDVSAPHSQDR